MQDSMFGSETVEEQSKLVNSMDATLCDAWQKDVLCDKQEV